MTATQLPFDEHNIHSIEFEAPPSADPTSSAAAQRHFSIDLSLELERQLDMESFPPTPAHYVESFPHQNEAATQEELNYESLDPHVLAHIVQQLRESLSDATKDRDELLEMVALSHTHEAEMKDALQHMTDKATTMEIELSDARKKLKDDEDAIHMLRAKVEESRRGLMRLQTESRRQSMTIDLSRAGAPAFGSPPSSKRASFTPLTGTFQSRSHGTHGHRRISSVSDAGIVAIDRSTSPNPQTQLLPDTLPPNPPPVSSRRYSGLFGRTSPPQPEAGHTEPLIAEIDSLRKELKTLRDELENAKHELSESNEAREASETCVTALREFIAENNIGVPATSSSSPLKLPPPPTMANGAEEDETKKTAGAATWGFKLWKDATVKAPVASQSATVAPPVAAPLPQMPASATPLTRKIGGFFSSRGSVSSVTSSTNTPPPTGLPQLQTNAATSVRDSIYSFSDTSSMAEPISPTNELDTHIIVRDVTNLSDVISLNLGPGTDMEKELRVDPQSHKGKVVS